MRLHALLMLPGMFFLLGAAPFSPTDDYQRRTLEGWSLYLDKAFDQEPALRDQALELLRTKLLDIKRMLPEPAVQKLHTVPIWIEVNNPKVKGACYHPSAEWLKAHDFNPDKAGGVELGNVKNFLEWSKVQPSMVLHEMAHAYHHQVLKHGNPELRAAFKAAVASKKYDSVLYYDGRMQRHYALNNDQEYFAEGSEAFFGTNDFYPFVRPELKQHDPALHDYLAKAWGVKLPRAATTRATTTPLSTSAPPPAP